MWLLKTIDELNIAGIPRARMLPDQLLNGELVDTSLNVQCSNTLRLDNPIGTIFEADSLEVKLNSQGIKYYEVHPTKMRVHKPIN